jgi:hypothetical protein
MISALIINERQLSIGRRSNMVWCSVVSTLNRRESEYNTAEGKNQLSSHASIRCRINLRQRGPSSCRGRDTRPMVASTLSVLLMIDGE